MLIESDNGHFRARVEESDDGCLVTYYKKYKDEWKPMYPSPYPLPVPFHIGLDMAHDIVNAIR